MNTECGGCEFTVNDPISVFVRNCLKEVLTDFASHYDYLEYWNTNLSLRFDFSYLEDSILSLIFYDLKIKVSYLEPICFEFIVTSFF